MSENQEKETKETVKSSALKLSDDAIVMIRELIQLSILTGTNVVDHFRALQLEPTEENPSLLTVTEDYLNAYNDMVNKLNEAAVKMHEEAQKKVVVSDGTN